MLAVTAWGALSGGARGALPPLSYPVSTATTELKPAVLGNQPGVHGVSLTVEDAAAPQFSGVHLWGRLPDGRLATHKVVPVPGLYAHLPVRLGSSAYDDVFYAVHQGSTLTVGLLRGAGGAYDPAGSVLASFPATIAPPRGQVVAAASNFNATPGHDVLLLAAPDAALLFRDDGAGALLPIPETVSLAPVADASSIVAADVTGDGLPDLLVGSVTSQTITVFRNTTVLPGPSTFALLQTVPVTGLRAFGAGDLDGDGAAWMDVVAARQVGATAEVLVALNSTGGTPFGPVQSYAVDGNPVALALADLAPADGDPDVFVACRSAAQSGSLVELSNNGGGGLGITGQYYVATATAANAASASGEFVGVHDPQAGSFTIYPMADLNVSPADGVVAAPGPDPSADARVMAFRADGTPIASTQTVAYAAKHGVRVANSNVDGDEVVHARDELVTGPGPSPNLGPHVRAFRRAAFSLTPVAKISFYAYGTLRAGVNVSGPNVDRDGPDEIVTGPGPSGAFGPQVRGWNYDGVALSPIAKINFFAYATLKFGVEVGGGWDAEDDDDDEILTGPGPGPTFAAQVRGFSYDGTAVTPIGKVSFVAMGAPIGHGCTVGGGDVDEDGFDEIVVTRGPGPSQGHQYRGFNYDGISLYPLLGYDVTPRPTLYGGRLGLGDTAGGTNDAGDDMMTSPGPDPAADSAVTIYVYDLTQVLPAVSFPTFAGTAYGASTAGVAFGF